MNLNRPLLAIAAGLFAAGVVAGTALTGYLGNATAAVAYASGALAVGTDLLAYGAIVTYLEQRETNREQKKLIETQHLAAAEAEAGQVRIRRLTDAGEFALVEVTNGSRRAIRRLRVAVRVDGGEGPPWKCSVRTNRNADDMRRGTWVNDDDSGLKDARWWEMRAMWPGETEKFQQIEYLIASPLMQPSPGGLITAYAEFTDAEGIRWSADQDGNLERISPDA